MALISQQTFLKHFCKKIWIRTLFYLSLYKLKRDIWKKLTDLENCLHNNDVSDKKSACFWDTCEFDTPPVYIPRVQLDNNYHVYGCFCSPECAVAYLLKENIDAASRFERLHLLNHMYGKICNYERSIKPAPDPYYTLDKYYGNLTISSPATTFEESTALYSGITIKAAATNGTQ